MNALGKVKSFRLSANFTYICLSAIDCTFPSPNFLCITVIPTVIDDSSKSGVLLRFLSGKGDFMPNFSVTRGGAVGIATVDLPDG